MLQQHSANTVRKVINHFYQNFDYERLPGIEDQEDYRTPFQIDRDRIAFSGSFRRLQSKTQVFRSGEYDFYRTRLTHSIEVARIGHSICDFLKATSPYLSNEFFIDPDLVEALGLAHDLGHPPFGHIGERKLNDLMHAYGGFEGNAQTLRIITELIYNRDIGPRGMSPTRALLDGLCKYKAFQKECIAENKSQPNPYPDNHFIYDEQEPYRQFIFNSKELPSAFGKNPSTQAINSLRSIECQIMDWADDTAYSMHDIVDGIQAGFLNQDKIERWSEHQSAFTPIQNEALERLFESIQTNKLEARFSKQIGTFIRACRLKERKDANCPLIQSTNRYRFTLEIDSHIAQECYLYKKIAYSLIFDSPQMQQIEFKGGRILELLFKALVDNYSSTTENRTLELLPQRTTRWIKSASTQQEQIRRICDYLASLTDAFALRLYKRLYDPDFGSITDLI